MSKKLYQFFLILLAFSGIVISQFLFDNERGKAGYNEPLILRPEIIKAADLGLHNAASDLVWLNAIQYFGGNGSKTYQQLPDYLSLASDLDPKFSYPYAFGALILPSLGHPDQGIELAKKGMENSLPDWRIPYYLATTYYLNKNDQANAAKYFDIAANTKDAPDGIKKVSANFGSRKDKRSQTEQIWEGIYETTNDSVVKERAKNYILHFRIMDLLEQASTKYFEINNEYPVNINDLVSARIINEIPKDPFGLEFEINNDGTVTAN